MSCELTVQPEDLKTSEDIESILKEYDALRIRSAAGDCDFTLNGAHGSCCCINNSDNELFIDNFAIAPHESYQIEGRAIFLYDSRKHIFGFDPEYQDIWKLQEKECGAEVCINHLKCLYPQLDGSVSGIENIDASLHPSEFVGIYGPSGCGKSVLLESILAPEYHTVFWQRLTRRIFDFASGSRKGQRSGSVKIDGQAPRDSVEKIAYLPQNLNPPKHLLCKELLRLAMTDRGDKQCMRNEQAMTETLKLCGLDESIKAKRCGDLSGGQMRRLTLAMALLRGKGKTRLLILDEPTSGLDIDSELKVMQTLRRISRSGITVITVTHSVAACRLFDRVLVLRKPSPEKGSELAYNGLWDDSCMPETLKDSRLTDAERLKRLMGEHSNLLHPRCEQMNFNWPFAFQAEENKSAIRKKWDNVKEWVGNYLSKRTKRQVFEWFRDGWLIIWRDRKSLCTFLLLAMCCVLAVQLGVTKAVNPEIQIITVLSLAAPWLCATYAVIFTSDLLRFFAWEKFSGLRSSNFALGIFLAQLLPAVLIAGIFTLGMFAAPDKDNITKTMLSVCIDKNDKSVWLLRPFLKDDAEEEYAGTLQDFKEAERNPDPDMPLNTSIVMNPLDNVWQSIKNNTSNEYRQIQTSRTSFKVFNNQMAVMPIWGTMLFICMTGSMLGICAAAIFRNAKNAMLFVVVLFIVYLLFSRLFMTNAGDYLLPLNELYGHFGNDSICLQPYELGMNLFSIIVSFVCIGRYGVNLLCYQPDSYARLWDAVPLLLIILTAFAVTVCSFNNHKKNWKELSR